MINPSTQVAELMLNSNSRIKLGEIYLSGISGLRGQPVSTRGSFSSSFPSSVSTRLTVNRPAGERITDQSTAMKSIIFKTIRFERSPLTICKTISPPQTFRIYDPRLFSPSRGILRSVVVCVACSERLAHMGKPLSL